MIFEVKYTVLQKNVNLLL